MGEADMSTGTEENFTNEDRRQLTVRNLTIGKGIPKICVPLTGITQEEILTEAGRLEQFPADLAEWRVDWYAQAKDVAAV